MTCKVITSGFLLSTSFNNPNTCSGAAHTTGQALGVCQEADGLYTMLSSTGVFNGILSVIVSSFTDTKCTVSAGDATVLPLSVGCTDPSQTLGSAYALSSALPSNAVSDGYFLTTRYEASSTCNGLTGTASQDAVPVAPACTLTSGGVYVTQTLTAVSLSSVALTSSYFSDSRCSSALYFFTDTFSTTCQPFDSGSIQYGYTDVALPAFNYPGAVTVETFPSALSCTTPTEVHSTSPDYCFYDGASASHKWNCLTPTTFQQTTYLTSNCQGDSTATSMVGPTCGTAASAVTFMCNVGSTGFFVRTSYDDPNSCSGSFHTYAQALGVCHESDGAFVILTTLGISSSELEITVTTYTDATCVTATADTPVQLYFPVGCTDPSQTFGQSYSLVEAPPAPVASSGYFSTTRYGASTTCEGYAGIMSQDAVSVGRCDNGPSGYFSQTITGLSSDVITLTSTYYADQCVTPLYFFTDSFSHACQTFDAGSVLYSFSASAPAFAYPGAVETDVFPDSQSCTSPLDIHWNSPDYCFYDGVSASHQMHCAGTGSSFTLSSYITPDCSGTATTTTAPGPVCGEAGADSTVTCNVVDSGFFVFRYYEDSSTCTGGFHEYGQALGICEIYGTTSIRVTSLGSFGGSLNLVITTYSDTACSVVSVVTPPSSLDFPVGCGSSGVGYSTYLTATVPASTVGAGYFVTTDYGASSTCSGYQSLSSQDAYRLNQCLPTASGTFVTQLVTGSSASGILFTSVYFRDRVCTQTLFYFSDTYPSTCALVDGDYVVAAYSAVKPAFAYDGSVEMDTYADLTCSAPVELHWAAPSFCYYNVTSSYTWSCSGVAFTKTTFTTPDCSGTPKSAVVPASACGTSNSLASMLCTVAATAVPTLAPIAVPTLAPVGVPTTTVPTVAPTPLVPGPTAAPNVVPVPSPAPTSTSLPPVSAPTPAPTYIPGSPTPVPTPAAPTRTPTGVPTPAITAAPSADANADTTSSTDDSTASLGGGAIAGIAIGIIAAVAIAVYVYYYYYMREAPETAVSGQGAYPENTLKKSLLDSNSRVI